MTSHEDEGDFESIIEDDSLENVADDLDALDVLSNREVSSEEDSDEVESEESKLKKLIARGKEQGYLTYEQLTETLPERIEESDDF